MLVAANAGPAFATGVVVTDTLPVGVTASAATSSIGTCTIAGRTVTCAVGNLQAGGTATITITATGMAAGLVTNTASIAGAELDPFTGNNTDSEETTIQLASCSARDLHRSGALCGIRRRPMAVGPAGRT